LPDEIIASELTGRTLQVYWHLLKSPNSPISVREVQRSLKFSTPSVALYHLRKLQELGLVERKPTGEYFLIKEVKIGILSFFTRLGKFLLPRYIFHSTLLSTMLVLYLTLYVNMLWDPAFQTAYMAGIMISAVACSIMWFETYKMLRERPF
jgi:hypothetical protein